MKAEEIVNRLIREYALDDDFVCLDDYRYLFKKAMKEYHQAKLQALKEEVEELLEFHAERRDSADKELEYAHHHGIVEGCVKFKNLITNLEDK